MILDNFSRINRGSKIISTNSSEAMSLHHKNCCFASNLQPIIRRRLSTFPGLYFGGSKDSVGLGNLRREPSSKISRPHYLYFGSDEPSPQELLLRFQPPANISSQSKDHLDHRPPHLNLKKSALIIPRITPINTKLCSWNC